MTYPVFGPKRADYFGQLTPTPQIQAPCGFPRFGTPNKSSYFSPISGKIPVTPQTA